MRFEIKEYTELKLALERLCAFLEEREVSAERVFDSRLVAHELVGNVLQHAKGSARLGVELDGGLICITVGADSNFQPEGRATCPEAGAERGRGLYLVERLTVEQKYTDEGIFVWLKK